MKFNILLFIVLLPVSVSADPIYKTVDDKGSVTYSTEVPSAGAEVKTVDLPPAPTKAQASQSKQQHENIKEKSESIGQSLQQRAKKNIKKEIKKEDQTVESKETLTDPNPGRALRNPNISHPIN